MKNFIIFIIGLVVLASIVQATSNLYFSITLDYNSGELTKRDVNLIQSNEALNLSKKTGDYKLVLNSFREDALYQTYFDITTQITPSGLKEWFDEKGNQIVVSEKPVDLKLTKATIVLFVPYFRNAHGIKIYDKNNELKLTIDISDFATCNMNKVCDLKESHELCPEDCPLQDVHFKLSWWQRIINFIKNLFE